MTTNEAIDNPVWEELSPMVWREAVYGDNAVSNCMGQLFLKEVDFFSEVAFKAKEEEQKVAIVEVGMGTAELFSKVHDEYDYLAGVELSQTFVDCAFELHPHLRELQGGKVRLIQGNAVELGRVLAQEFPHKHEFWDTRTLRISCMCMNTFGIIPDFVRRKAVKQMFRVSGPGGRVIIGCWRKEGLRSGFNEFYSKNPQLCGPCKEGDFNFDSGDFKCGSYTSHWWTEDELKAAILENFPGKIPENLAIRFEVMGVGIFAICDIPLDVAFDEAE